VHGMVLGLAHVADGTALYDVAHVHHAQDKPCRECPSKAGPGALCQMACAAAVAVLDTPAPSLGPCLAYAVQFAAGPPVPTQGAAPAPDPFPPRPSRIA
jgi:hypothetical protein